MSIWLKRLHQSINIYYGKTFLLFYYQNNYPEELFNDK